MRLSSHHQTRNLAPLAHGESSLIRASGELPRLLVSVRSLEEAQIAISAGSAIIDVKEPLRGSLGMAALDVISEIASLESISSGAIPLSVALGELGDWQDANKIPKLAAGISYAKLGLYGSEPLSDWRSDCWRAREHFQQRAESHLKWVAVAYADFKTAHSASLFEVTQFAIETQCAGVLIDTWSKSNITLVDRIDPAALVVAAESCHAAGLFFAIAGKLTLDSLPRLANVPADVVAIRSAACSETIRTATLDAARITEFAKELRIFSR